MYSTPSHGKQKFKALLHKVCNIAGPNSRLFICCDFYAPNQALGYHKTLAKGRDLIQNVTDFGLNRIVNPAHITRIVNSITRDTTPDHTFVRGNGGGTAEFEWRNTGHEFGSKHYIGEVAFRSVATKKLAEAFGNIFEDWDAFRGLLPPFSAKKIDDGRGGRGQALNSN